jgi:phage baseplate assembly protein W
MNSKLTKTKGHICLDKVMTLTQVDMPMSNSTLDLLKLLSSPEELRESIRQIVQTAINDLMKVELGSVLGYQHIFDTEYGAVELNVPPRSKE